MNLKRIFFFSIVVYVLNVLVGMLVGYTFFLGSSGNMLLFVVIGYCVGGLVSVFVFALLAKEQATKPYLHGFLVTAFSSVMSVFSAFLVVGDAFSRETLLFDFILLILEMLLGVFWGQRIMQLQRDDNDLT